MRSFWWVDSLCTSSAVNRCLDVLKDLLHHRTGCFRSTSHMKLGNYFASHFHLLFERKTPWMDVSGSNNHWSLCLDTYGPLLFPICRHHCKREKVCRVKSVKFVVRWWEQTKCRTSLKCLCQAKFYSDGSFKSHFNTRNNIHQTKAQQYYDAIKFINNKTLSTFPRNKIQRWW